MHEIILSERAIGIIQMTEKQSYIQLDEVAKRLQVSTRTIRNDIKQLNFDLFGIAQVQSERGKGVYLHVLDELALDAVMAVNHENIASHHPKYRLAQIMERLMHHDEVYTLDDLADALFISRSTLVNELKKAVIPLKSYRLHIEGKPNQGVFLKGREFDLRLFLIEYMYEVLFADYPIGDDVCEAIVEVLNHHHLESTTQTRVLQFTSVMLERHLKGYSLEEPDAKHRQLMGTNDYEIALEIVEVLERLLPVKIPIGEILFITIPIHGRRTTTNQDTVGNVLITPEVKELIEEIMIQIGFTKDTLDENRAFFTDLEYHITFLMNRLAFGMRLKNPLLVDIVEKYPVAFRMGEIAAEVIERKYNLQVTDDEIGYLAFYFGVFIESTNKKVRTIRRAAIICGSGRGTAQLLAIQLERVLKHSTQIEVFSEQQVTSEQLSDFDFVFSTVNLPFKVNVPFIQISEIFDETLVALEVKKHLSKHGYEQSVGRPYSSTLMNLLSEERFYQLNPLEGYHENVNNMVEDLTEKGYVDTDFKERLLARENKGSMAFDRFIALPHTFQLASDSVELALGIFPQGVEENGKEIRLVFLLGLPVQQSDYIEHLIVKIYDEIIGIANDDKLLDGLLSARTYEDVEEVLS